MAAHTLQIGDIIFAVDGAEADPIANTPELYINLHKIAGETFQLGLIRDGERMKMPLKSARLSFRK
jgi:S1-C subfamily serine protease